MNRHDFTPLELAEVFRDAGDDYVKSGDRIGYVNRMHALGIINSEILENLRDLDIRRAELFNQALAAGQRHLTYRSTRGRAA